MKIPVSPDKFKSVKFIVEGGGSFPIDMLRYDSACPDTGEDAAKLARHHVPALARVTLRRFFPVGCSEMPEVERWESFGWRVVSVNGVTLPSYTKAIAAEVLRETPPALTEAEHALATGGKFIDAIKLARERTGCSLRAAKTAVDVARGL